MIDKEKVINDLQDAVNDDWMWRHADYYALTMERAIALLKEQGEKTGHWNGPECSRCHAILERKWRFEYCPYCGAKMDNAEGR